MRKARFAGMFYENDFNKLNKQIEECFYDELGPGDLNVKRTGKKLIGIVVPHAGYGYSGMCQAWAYKELGESKFPSCYIILGTSHNGQRGLSMENWETPIGIIRVDQGLGREIMEKCKFIKQDNNAHYDEHSIEVQLPFLQFVNKDKLNELKILPLMISGYSLEEMRKLGEVIAEINENVVIVISTDFIHFGESYGFMPFKYSIKEGIENLDNKAIDLIKEFKSREFLDLVNKNKLTICGYEAIIAGIEICKALYAKKISLLSYYKSGDLTNSYDTSVSYIAMKIE